MATTRLPLGLAALLCGAATLGLSLPAEAQWGGYGGRFPHHGGGRVDGRRCPMGDCGYHRGPSRGGGGKICYNIAGRPYLSKGRGRCPIS